MSNYTITTNFGAKDSLPSGNAGKVIKGSEFTTEFTNIQTAVATKADTAGDTFTGAVNFSADVAVNTNTLFVDVSENKVGIGTSSPEKNLHLAGTNAQYVLLHSTANTNIAGDVSGGLLFMNGDDSVPAGDRITAALKATVEDEFGRQALTFSTSTTNPKTSYAQAVDYTDNTIERMRITSSGKVGIGTTSPTEKLQVNGNIKIGDSHIIGNDAFDNLTLISSSPEGIVYGSNTDHIIKTGSTGLDATGTELMRIAASGNVGIGTDSPDYELDISQTSNASPVGLRIQNSEGSFILRTNGNQTLMDAGADLIFRNSSETEHMRIDSSGKVGIGTSSPDEKLVVKGGTYAANQSGGMALQMGDTSGSHWQSSFKIKSDGSGNVRTTLDASTGAIGGQSQEVISINTAGNVGIGTTSPDVKLDVTEAYDTVSNVLSNGSYAAKFSSSGSGNAGRAQGILLSGQDGNSRGVALLAEAQSTGNAHDFVIATSASSSTPTERMRIDSSGVLSVANTTTAFGLRTTATLTGMSYTPGDYLSVASTGYALSLNRINSNGGLAYFNKDGTTVGSISVTGSATAYNTSSDERLKENITDSADAGSKVDAIQIRQFDWKADGSHQDYGVIAQELINVAPEAVSEGDTEEDMMGVDYSKLVPMLIKEVQSLRSRVAELENV